MGAGFYRMRTAALALAAALLSIACPGAFAQKTVVTTGEDAFLLARDLVERGALDEAEAILRTLAEAGPTGPIDQTALAKLTAKLAYEQGRVDDAVTLLEAMVDADPDNWRNRYDLAHVLMAERRDRQAEQQLRAILRLRPDLPQEVGRRARSDLAALDARRVVRIDFAAAAAPSTNVNSATSNETFEVFGVLPARLDDEARAQSGVGLNYRLSGLITPAIRDGLRGHLLLRGQSADYQGASFDQASTGLEIGVRVGGAFGGRWSALVAATADRQFFGGDAYALSAGGRVSGTYSVTPRLGLSAGVAAARLTYDDQPNRDGPIVSASLGAGMTVGARLFLSAGMRAAREIAQDDALSNTQGTVSLGASVALPAQLNVGVQPSVTWRRFDEASVLYGMRREDQTIDVSTSLRLREFDVRGFVPSFSYRYTDNESTVSLFDYDRHTADIGLSRAF